MNVEKYLVLNKYLLSLFGVGEFKELQQKLRDAQTGYDSEGRSHFARVLRSSLSNLKISEDKLWEYDENIRSHVEKINYNREINLKYFQYLALLFTEIVLDNLKNRKSYFIEELNSFLEKYKKEQLINIIDKFKEDDLRKLAFWMATGSGKTLIMHINYHQFFKYNLFSPDNIILITPNEGLSKQHYEELQKSGIPCKLYKGSLNGGIGQGNEVLVIEITKLVEEKKGGGVTIPVDAFEGKNLVFVDEGHKGRKSEDQKWAQLRNRLAENGFTFEYSATFGQILNEREGREVLKEYAKSIVFDYSYKYFYLDGYGKDFSVLNVRNGRDTNDFQERMFVANLLSFYEQLLVYEQNKDLVKKYNIEKPLWIFVGTTVSEEESDIIQIVRFIKKVIEDEEWLRKWIENILGGNTGLTDENGKDIFEGKFKYLRENGIDLMDIYKRIFGGKAKLNLYEIKNAEGEIGLKVGENDYFGIINIGNVSGFRRLLGGEGISVEQDVISGSLFDKIKEENSNINILIGSRKFIEGWDTWRVSSMGLLNMGTGKGPQIIQLFGRGVRLKGKGMSLKRSGDSDEIKILETLNIYGIKADYLEKFLEAIEKEDVEFEAIEIPIKSQHEDKWNSLYTLSLSKSEEQFKEEKVLRLEITEEINCVINLLPKVSLHQSGGESGVESTEIKAQTKDMKEKLKEVLDLLDWERIWLEMIEYKKQKEYWNLTFTKEDIRKILASDNYKIYVREEEFEIKSKEDLRRIENIALLVIKKYIDSFYQKKLKHFETENLRCETLEKIPFPKVTEDTLEYIVYINKSKSDIIQQIKQLVQNSNELFEKEGGALPHVYFDRSLYAPLLLEAKGDIEKIVPQGLVDSEKKFIEGLRNCLKENKDEFDDVEIYLLRNYPFSGVGFQLRWTKFYPDFIMWMKKDEKQAIVFIDPKGLEHTKGLDDEKLQFRKYLKEELGGKIDCANVVFDTFILSVTSYIEVVRGMANPPEKTEYEKLNVLFLEDSDWACKLLSDVKRLLIS